MKKTNSSTGFAFVCGAVLVLGCMLYGAVTSCNDAHAQNLEFESDSISISEKVDTILTGEEYDFFTLVDHEGVIHGYRVQLGAEGDTLKCSRDLYEVLEGYYNMEIPQQEIHVSLDEDKDSLILVDAPQEVLTVQGHKHNYKVLECYSQCEIVK